MQMMLYRFCLSHQISSFLSHILTSRCISGKWPSANLKPACFVRGRVIGSQLRLRDQGEPRLKWRIAPVLRPTREQAVPFGCLSDTTTSGP